MDLVSFGKMLKSARVARRISQKALAGAISVVEITVRKYEAGERRPSAATIEKIADHLGLAPEQRARLRYLAGAGGPPEGAAAARVAPPADEAPAAPGPWPPLPTPLTELIGRDGQVAELRERLGRRGQRLLTLTGPPGVGKTRLGIAAAVAAADLFPDGLAFFDLSAAGDAQQAVDHMARGAGRADGPQPALGGLAARIAGGRVLLVLDGLERLPRLGEHLLRLLGDCPALAIMATSRAPLRVRGEQSIPVEPLAPPGDVGAALESPALALFVACARAADPLFELSEGNRAEVAQICRRLDGLPLAIELAAARVSVLSPGELLARLEGSLDILADGPTDLPPRHQTMRAAIAWSYDLLAPGDQALFRALGALRHEYPLSTIEALAGDGGARDLMRGAAALHDSGMLRRVGEQDGATWVTMLGPIRAYAAERLAESPGAAELRRRWACHYLAQAEAIAAAGGEGRRRHWRRLEREHANFTAALRWLLAEGATAEAARLAHALSAFWLRQGYWAEGRQLLDAILAHPAPPPAPGLRLALRHAGVLARRQGDYGRSQELLDRSLEMARQAGDAAGEAYLLNQLGLVAASQSLHDEAEALYGQSLALWGRLGETQQELAVRGNLATLAANRGDYGRGLELHRQNLETRRRIADHRGVSYTLCNMGLVAWHQGDHQRSLAYLQESLGLAEQLGDQILSTAARCNMGFLLLTMGDLDGAAGCFHTTLRAYVELGDKRGIAYCVEGVAGVMARRRRGEEAIRLFSAAETLRVRMNAALPPVERQLYDALLAEARAQCDDLAYALARADGQRWRLDELVARALRPES